MCPSAHQALRDAGLIRKKNDNCQQQANLRIGKKGTLYQQQLKEQQGSRINGIYISEIPIAENKVNPYMLLLGIRNEGWTRVVKSTYASHIFHKPYVNAPI
jgi:hypothetical protein